MDQIQSVTAVLPPNTYARSWEVKHPNHVAKFRALYITTKSCSSIAEEMTIDGAPMVACTVTEVAVRLGLQQRRSPTHDPSKRTTRGVSIMDHKPLSVRITEAKQVREEALNRYVSADELVQSLEAEARTLVEQLRAEATKLEEELAS